MSLFCGSVPAEASSNLRGLDHERRLTSDALRYFCTVAVYLPKQVINATLAASAKTAGIVSDPEFIEKVKDILYLYDRKLMWFPIFTYESDSRPQYGAGLFYQDGPFKALTRYSQNDADHWSVNFKTSYEKYLGHVIWKGAVKGLLERQDDYRYYGLGGDPKHDRRNRFTASDDYGIFTEETKQIQWESAVFHPTHRWSAQYMGYYQRRGFKSAGHGNKDLRDEMDLTTVPGFIHDAPVEQIYQEISFTFDTRNQKQIISKGVRTEIYGGLSNGLKANSADFMRSGFDAAVYLPVIRDDRIIVSRVVFDQVTPVDGVRIPFTEYPRHKTFRGFSSRYLTRNDKASSVLSMEYQWPISHMLTGHIFTDYLVAGSSAGDLRWTKAVWASGAGFGFHYLNKEFARIEFAGGNSGFHILIISAK